MVIASALSMGKEFVIFVRNLISLEKEGEVRPD
jgi:hypothetical protein